MGLRSVRIVCSALLLLSLLRAGTYEEARSLLADPPADARILMRWWWFGPAVTQSGLEAEMRQMKAGGIGGFEVQPVYPLALDGNLRFLSPEFLDMIRFTGAKARELGLRMDLTIGSGWPYGGPHITPELASGQLKLTPTPHAGKTGQMVKRPAVGGEGFVLDHYNHAALALHLKTVGEPLLAAAGPGHVTAAFCDSLEVYGGDWTARLPEEFQRRRGYDLTPYLQHLRAATAEAASVRHDFGQTLSEVYVDEFLRPLASWAHGKGVLLRMQNYGTPPATLASNRLVDRPEGEGWHWRRFTTTRWASSANHLFGQPVTSSETWTWVHSPSFRATPQDLKAEADQQFLCGVNQIVGHGWPYSPAAAGEPGQSLYAAGALNAHNPWWPVMPELSLYLQRTSALLRAGEPAAGVGLYLPNHDAWAGFVTSTVNLWAAVSARVSPLVPAILDAGYGVDAFDDETAAAALERYRVIVLPGVERMAPALLAKLEAFAARGGTVIAVGRMPSLAPGLREQGQSAEVAQRAERLLRAGLVSDAAGLTAALAKLGRAEVEGVDAKLGFVHRRLSNGDLYFLANTDNRARTVKLRFRTPYRQAERWDTLTGERQVLGGGAEQSVHLEAYGSAVMVFSNRLQKAVVPGPRVSEPIGGTWELSAGGRTLTGLQTVEADSAVIYRNRFVVKPGARRVWVDLGATIPGSGEKPANDAVFLADVTAPVREAAEVWVNGRRAGAAWCAPYRVEVTALAKPGENRLEIRVYPTAMNRMARRPRTDYSALNARFGKRFDMQDLDRVRALPVGLTGPVALMVEKENQ